MADMALEMHVFVSPYSAPNGEKISLRIGLAAGAIAAGVIGRRNFSYDLWGDAANIAARLSSEAQPGLTQVNAVTFRHLHSRYSFDEMHHIHVNCNGQMQVYNLRGKTRKLPNRS